MTKNELLFTRLDGQTDTAIIYVRKEQGYYAGYIKIGTIARKVLSGMIHKHDAHNGTVQILSYYKDNAVL